MSTKAPVTPAQRAVEALRDLGCFPTAKHDSKSRSKDKNKNKNKTASSSSRLAARLTAHPPSRHWQRFESSELDTPCPPDATAPFFAESAAPVGPFKLLPGSTQRKVRLVADLPLAIGEFQQQVSSEALPASFAENPGLDPREFLDTRTGGSLQLWAHDLAAALRPGGKGQASAALRGAGHAPQEAAPPPSDARIAAILSARGWTTSQHESGVRVNFESAEYFAQVELRSTPEGFAAEVNLTPTEGWSSESLAAAERLALYVHQHFKLVRLLHRAAGQGGRILAQVHFGSQPVDSPWLDVALSVLRDASESLARETPLLARPEIAEWILSTRC